MLSFRVVFRDPAQLMGRGSRATTTVLIEKAECPWAIKQKHGLTVDLREFTGSLEGIVEGIHNGNVTAAALAAERTRLKRLLRTYKKKSDHKRWDCDYTAHVFSGQAKPKELVRSWIFGMVPCQGTFGSKPRAQTVSSLPSPWDLLRPSLTAGLPVLRSNTRPYPTSHWSDNCCRCLRV